LHKFLIFLKHKSNNFTNVSHNKGIRYGAVKAALVRQFNGCPKNYLLAAMWKLLGYYLSCSVNQSIKMLEIFEN